MNDLEVEEDVELELDRRNQLGPHPARAGDLLGLLPHLQDLLARNEGADEALLASAREAALEQQRLQDRLRWERLGLPHRWFELWYDGGGGVRETEAHRHVETWWRAPARRSWLFLVGEKGNGKTFAASWLAARIGGRFVPAIELSRHGTYGEASAAWWQGLERAPMLVLDDLGEEVVDGAGYVLANLYAVLNRRYHDGRRTVLTSNLVYDIPPGAPRPPGVVETFVERYLTAGRGPLLRSRMVECADVYTVAGPDFRRPPEGA